MPDTEAIRTEMYSYLTTETFPLFSASDVADYDGAYQIWVNSETGYVTGKVRLIFDYVRLTNAFQIVTGPQALSAEFYAQMKLVALEFGAIIQANT